MYKYQTTFFSNVLLSTILVIVFLLSLSVNVVANNNNGLENGGFQGTWVRPNESDIPDTPAGDRVRYGKALLTETYKYLGSESIIGKHYIRSKLACSNCHLNAGTVAFSAPWSVVYHKYGDGSLGAKGIFSSRSNVSRTIQVRINGCMERSLNGKALPHDSEEMKAMIAYMKWLTTGMQVDNWTQVLGTGFIQVPDLNRAANPVRGKVVFEANCAKCHGADGQGLFEPDKMVFKYPALWGPDSFNHAAGMSRLRTGVKFVKGNMPFGAADPTRPEKQLSLEDAWDVMAYVLSNTRPVFANHLNDWTGIGPDGIPNWMRKRVDAAYPNYFPRTDRTDNLGLAPMFPPEQHKYGPYQNMLQIQKEIRQTFETSNP